MTMIATPLPATPLPAEGAGSSGEDSFSSVPALDRGAERWTLAAMCAALVAVVASVSGLNVAQQSLATEFGASQGQLLWVINGYTIVMAALLMPIGAIGDRWGRKKVLLAGLGIFVAANVASALAGSVSMLLVTRLVAGAAAAMIMPVTLSVITSTFSPEDRDRAVGVWAGFAGAGGILGLLASSLVIDHATWPWVFALPVGLALLAAAITVKVVPHSREAHRGTFDTLGSVLSAVAIGGLVLGIQEGPERGWTAPLTLLGLIGGGIALVGFIAHERRRPHPLLNVRIFANRAVSSGSLALLVMFAVVMGLFLVIVQFLQAVLGYSAVGASIGLMPMALVMLPMSAVAPVLTRRFGFRPMFLGGSMIAALGLVGMALLGSVEHGYVSLLPGLLLLSVGVGVLMTPGTTAITEGMPVEEQGVASALNDTVREFGAALGIALLGSVAASGYRAGVAEILPLLPEQAATVVRQGIGGAMHVAALAGRQGDPLMVVARDAFFDGWQTAMWVSAALLIVTGAVLGALTPRRRSTLTEV